MSARGPNSHGPSTLGPNTHGPSTRAFVAVGANVGPRRATIEWALRALDRAEGVRVVARSRLFTTEPVGGPVGQPRFLNGAFAVETTRTPHDLLALLLELEARAGRVRSRARTNGPRTLDLDLLAFGDRTVCDARLELPHPRMAERTFVLEPLATIAPDLVLTGAVGAGRTVAEQLARLRADADRGAAPERATPHPVPVSLRPVDAAPVA